MFTLSTVFFVLLFFVKTKLLAVIIFLLALMTNSGASTILWSIYCPSLKDTGRTSSATGFLDFISYIAAAIASSVFANAVSSVGWQPLIMIWAALMLAGIITCIPFKKFLPTKQNLKEIKAECPEHGKEPNMELFETSENSIEQTSEKTAEVTANDTSKETTE